MNDEKPERERCLDLDGDTHDAARLSDALVRVQARALAAASSGRVVDWLRRALERLERDVLAQAPRTSPEALESPLSRPVLDDALLTVARLRFELEEASAWLVRSRPVGRVAMILPSNVDVASARPLCWALLARNAVVLRPSSRRQGIAPLLAELLREADAELAEAVAFLRSAREQWEAMERLVAWADRVHVWGGEGAIAAIGTQAGNRLVAHGPGFGVAILTREGARALGDRGARHAWRGLAFDVARHDQRGCLSPHALIVEEGAAIGAGEAARAVFDALAELETTFPRGAVSVEERAAERLWRDVAIARGDALHEAPTFAVSAEQGPLRSCPTIRNLAVVAWERARIVDTVAKLGDKVKRLGVTPEAPVPDWLLSSAIEPVPWGAMQAPSLLASADGVAPWEGLALVDAASGKRARSGSEPIRIRRSGNVE